MKNCLDDKRTVLITGASSGLGAEFARQFSRRGFRVLMTGRNEKALEALSDELGGAEWLRADLSSVRGCLSVFRWAAAYRPDILINNAGLGTFGEFSKAALSREIEMINVNVRAVHILFRLFLRYFEKRGKGYILNVGSIAGFLPGPLMAGYYASKAYVIRQTEAVWAELLLTGSPVKVSVLCPGPVSTSFNANAGIEGFFKGLTPEKCVSITIDGMEWGIPVIVPSLSAKAVTAAAKLTPSLAASIGCYAAQKKKRPLRENTNG